MRFLFRIAVPLVGAFALMACRQARAVDVMNLETLAAALQAQLSSIRSIDVVYEIKPGGTIKPRPGAVTGPQRFEWAEQGEWLLLEEFDREDPNRLSGAVTFDGRRGFLFYEIPVVEGGSRFPAHMEISNTVASLYRGMPIVGFAYSKRGWPTAPSIPELIRLPGSAIVGEETVLGRRCYHVDVGKAEGPSGQPIKIVLYLDADHDFLPARVVWRYDTGDAQVDRFVETMDFKEYMRVRDAAGGVERWFPRLATSSSETLGTRIVTVQSVTINQALPVERFRPRAPDGTSIIDNTSEGEQKVYIVGGQPAQQALIKRAAEEAKAKLNEAPPAQRSGEVVIDARPSRGFGITPWLCVIAAVVCLSGAFYWFRRA